MVSVVFLQFFAQGVSIGAGILLILFRISVIGVTLKFINKFVSVHNSKTLLIKLFIVFDHIFLNICFSL